MRTLPLLIAAFLTAGLAELPIVASAQQDSVPQAMVEGNTSDINSWGFAVSVPAGQTVAWTNMGTQAHTATAVNGSFDTGMVSPGSSATLQFDVPGVYAYVCIP